MAAIELYTPQGAEMVSGMIYEPYMSRGNNLVGGYVRYISPHIIIIINIKWKYIKYVTVFHVIYLPVYQFMINIPCMAVVRVTWSYETVIK